MAEIKTKRLSTAEIIEEPGENTYILLEEDGAVKRIAGENLKTSGNGGGYIYPLYVDYDLDTANFDTIENMPSVDEIKDLIYDGYRFVLFVRLFGTIDDVEEGHIGKNPYSSANIISINLKSKDKTAGKKYLAT